MTVAGGAPERPTIEDGFTAVPAGRIATVVTHLDMLGPAAQRREASVPDLRLERRIDPTLEWYRALYAAVGRDWLWFSRLKMADDALAAILADEDVEVYALLDADRECGLLELDFREVGACELAFFGVVPSHVGIGAGRFLMNRAIEHAFAKPIQRFHVHTCTLDHPAALAFYVRSGFVPVRQQIEVAPDPRLTGVLATSAAPQIPMFAPADRESSAVDEGSS